ncbi:MAG: hypothetical protein ACLPHP_04090 [Candidatus Sulfotelmatobacter sp.]
MAPKTTIAGKLDDKPIPDALKTKVEHALKDVLEAEIPKVGGGVVGTHHISITHFSIVWDQA